MLFAISQPAFTFSKINKIHMRKPAAAHIIEITCFFLL